MSDPPRTPTPPGTFCGVGGGVGWGVLVTLPSPFVPSPPPPRSGRFLVAGDTDGFVTVWDTLSPPRPGGGPEDPPLLTPTLRFRALHDCINGTR